MYLIRAITIALLSLSLTNCGLFKKKKRSHTTSQDQGAAHKISIGLGKALTLVENATQVNFTVTCDGPAVITNLVDQVTLYGDQTNCVVTLDSFQVSGVTYTDSNQDQTFEGGGNSLDVVGSGVLPSPLNGDVNVNYTFSEIKSSNATVNNNITVTNVTLAVDGELAPNLSVTSAAIEALDKVNPGLRLQIDCNVALVDSKCDGLALADLKIALVDAPASSIDSAYLSGLSYEVATTRASGSIASFILDYNLSDLGGIDFATLQTKNYLFSMTHGTQASFRYSEINNNKQWRSELTLASTGNTQRKFVTDFDASGNGVAAWLDDSWQIFAAYYTASTQSWSAVQNISVSGHSQHEEPEVAAGGGKAIVSFRSFNGIWNAQAVIYQDGAFVPAAQLTNSDSRNGRVDMNENGDAVVTMIYGGGGAHSVYAKFYSSGVWQPTLSVESDNSTDANFHASGYNLPDVSLNDDGDAIVAWRHWETGPGNFYMYTSYKQAHSPSFTGKLYVESTTAHQQSYDYHIVLSNRIGGAPHTAVATTMWLRELGGAQTLTHSRYTLGQSHAPGVDLTGATNISNLRLAINDSGKVMAVFRSGLGNHTISSVYHNGSG